MKGMKTHRPNKLLGQHFLTCEWVLPALAKAADLQPDDTILEIGPGTGILTRFLAARAKKVIAVEKDRTLSAALSKALVKEKVFNVDVMSEDILRYDLKTLPSPYKVVANIPYYLTSRLIRILLEEEQKSKTIIFTIQKEVAERIIANPPDMNILALSVQAYGTPEIIADVPASCFSPQPKVDSAILKISDISEDFFTKSQIEPKDFFTLIKAGFSSRRKVLTTTLASFASKKELMHALNSIGHLPTIRPQELSLEEWAQLVRSLFY
jgi:16S rRNA (adenine1518-N6/adenine1519-N6)-dimethyltransferase